MLRHRQPKQAQLYFWRAVATWFPYPRAWYRILWSPVRDEPLELQNNLNVIMLSSIPISLVIPHYRRDDILIATIRHVLRLDPKPAESLGALFERRLLPMMRPAISLLAVPAFWAFAEWRLGLLLCLATAILQDPLRKLTPDQPVIFVVFVGVVFGAACLGAWAQGVPLTPSSIFGRDRRIAVPMWLLLLLIILEAFNSYFHFGNPMITLIGLLTYLLPLPSIVFAYQLVRRGGEARIHQFMTAYLLLHHACANNSLFGICGLRLAGVWAGRRQPSDI